MMVYTRKTVLQCFVSQSLVKTCRRWLLFLHSVCWSLGADLLFPLGCNMRKASAVFFFPNAGVIVIGNKAIRS